MGVPQAGKKVRPSNNRRHRSYCRAYVGDGRASDPSLPLSVTRRVGVIGVWRAPIRVIRIWTARRRPHCCRVSFRIPGPRSHFPWRLRRNNRGLRRAGFLDDLLSAKTIPILPIRLLGLKVLPIVPNFDCMTGRWGTQQQDRRHNEQHTLHFIPRCWQSTGLMRFSTEPPLTNGANRG